jgi:hypothetical protein
VPQATQATQATQADSLTFAGATPALLAIAATTAPTLLAYNAAPSPTFLNQALAFALWGAFVLAAAPLARALGPQRWRPGLPEAALVLLAAAVAWSWGPGSLPSTLSAGSLPALEAWSRELQRVARHATHPWNEGVLLDALVAQAARALAPRDARPGSQGNAPGAGFATLPA